MHAPLPTTESTVDKVSKSRQMKTHLEDDLQEINIELDVVSESDDMLQFPQSEDFLPSAPGGLPGTNSSDSLADDAEFNTGSALHFIQNKKDTSSNPVEGLNPASGKSRETVPQSEGGIQRHGSLTGDKGQINQIVSGQRSVSGIKQTVAEQGSMSFPALHHGSSQSQLVCPNVDRVPGPL